MINVSHVISNYFVFTVFFLSDLNMDGFFYVFINLFIFFPDTMLKNLAIFLCLVLVASAQLMKYNYYDNDLLDLDMPDSDYFRSPVRRISPRFHRPAIRTPVRRRISAVKSHSRISSRIPNVRYMSS